MILLLLVYLGGVLTIVSPCILPVLPFVFARSEQNLLTQRAADAGRDGGDFRRHCHAGGGGRGWAVRLNQYGRWFALALMAAFALTLLSRGLAEWATRPLVRLGNRLLPPVGSRRTAPCCPHCCSELPPGFVGAVRRPGAGSGAHGRCDIRTQRAHHFAAVCLCRGCRNFAGRGDSGRRQSVCGHEEVPGSGRMDPPRARSRGVARRRHDRHGLGQQRADAPVAGRHEPARAIADRPTQARAPPVPAAMSTMVISEPTAQQLAALRSRRSVGRAAGRRQLPPLSGATAWLNSAPLTPEQRCAARSCWSISGPTPASTACARCPT